MRSRAFTIIETIVYLSLFIILLFILNRVVLEVQSYTLFLNNFNERLLRRRVLFDVAMRDMVSRDVNKSFVKNEDAYIFTKNYKEVGFVIKDERIVRVEGKYDFGSKKWKKKYSSLAFTGKQGIGIMNQLYIRSRNEKK